MFQFLQDISRRPDMYGIRSSIGAECSILGYYSAYFIYNAKLNKEAKYFLHFSNFINEFYTEKNCFSWGNLIRFKSGSNDESLLEFRSLLSDFYKNKGKFGEEISIQFSNNYTKYFIQCRNFEDFLKIINFERTHFLIDSVIEIRNLIIGYQAAFAEIQIINKITDISLKNYTLKENEIKKYIGEKYMLPKALWNIDILAFLSSPMSNSIDEFMDVYKTVCRAND
jgi:hypothetical protein